MGPHHPQDVADRNAAIRVQQAHNEREYKQQLVIPLGASVFVP